MFAIILALSGALARLGAGTGAKIKKKLRQGFLSGSLYNIIYIIYIFSFGS
jgi:Na+-driven multidrug efflux pump